MSEVKHEIGALRVWHIPQVPGEAFHVYVDTPQEAQRVLQVLSLYDIFQVDRHIKPECFSVGGLEIYEDNAGEGVPGWCEWCDEETGDDIDSWVDRDAITAPTP